MGPDVEEYRPGGTGLLSFADRVNDFAFGEDSPRAYLERCLERIAAVEPEVQAWVVLNEEGSRRAADESTRRWRDGEQRSSIDGMPVGIKDLLETKDMPTEMGSAALVGNFPKRDNPAVWALRQAGAVVVGKTVTTEFGSSEPTRTVNPVDHSHSPGGSSSGSGAAVGAAMVPSALGSQVGSSILRPASYCGCYTLKPTFGALHRGDRQMYSQSATGPLAGSLADVWQTAIEIARRSGGDPGHRGLDGPEALPLAQRPNALAVLETDRWSEVDPALQGGFDAVLEQIANSGVEVLRRDDLPELERFEESLVGMIGVSRIIVDWERQWSLRSTIEEHPDGVSARARANLMASDKITLEEYRAQLDKRDAMVRRLSALSHLVDGFVSPGAQTPPPLFDRTLVGTSAYATGNPMGISSFSTATSVLGTPGVSLPWMSVGGLPVGIQVMTQPHRDAEAVAIARWFTEAVTPVSV